MKTMSMLGAALMALVIGGTAGMAGPAAADNYMGQGLQPPGYKYKSQYARKSGLYLNLGGIAYVRVPTPVCAHRGKTR